MANVLVEREYLELIAAAIRVKTGSTNTFTPAEMPEAILSISGGTIEYTLSSLGVTTPPDKLTYTNGDEFDPTGMVVTAYYTNPPSSTSMVVSNYTYSPTIVTDDTAFITIQYTEDDITVQTTLDITVNPSIVSYSFVAPTKTSYQYGDTLDTTGGKIVAHYSDGSTTDITEGIVYSPTILTTITDSQTINVTWENQSFSYNVSVSKRSVTKPTAAQDTFTYDGTAKSIIFNNFNDLYMSVSTNSLTNAGTKNVYVYLSDTDVNQWADGTTNRLTFVLTVNKAAATIFADTYTVNFTTEVLSAIINITTNSDGDIVATPSSSNVNAAVDQSNNTVTLSLDTAIEETSTVIIYVAEGDNYLASSNIAINVVAKAGWDWGTETSNVDITWLDELSAVIADMTAEERAALVGKTKRFNSGNFAPTIPASILCIGSDIDGAGTLTFEVKYVSNSSDINSFDDIATLCETFEAGLPQTLRNHIQTVSKPNNDIQTTWRVFPLSVDELGDSSLGLNDGTKYPYFETASDRRRLNGVGTINRGFLTRTRVNGLIYYVNRQGNILSASTVSGINRNIGYNFAFK